MNVLTEAVLRSQLKKHKLDRYEVRSDMIITPSARQYLKENNIELVVQEEITASKGRQVEEKIQDEPKKPKYICSYTGGYFDEKPEFMTQLYGNKLVYKDHPRIVLRGKLDSIQSKTLELQLMAHNKKLEGLKKDLNEVLILLRNILRAEVLEEELKALTLFGYREEALREMSHHPKKYFNIDHVLPNYEMGEMVLGLNTLRSSTREVELAAIHAFKSDGEFHRVDIIQGLNRLSSGIYILMCRTVSGFYK